ncbi:ParA family protein, partial [Serratia bockelmannii]|uniref:ParA family protein n=1 Tax=Serratia bockelmannii TaxID=2703793 RepID=UPI003D070D1D
MQVVSIISTKGGVGKTTTAANLGGLAADAGAGFADALRRSLSARLRPGNR